MKKKMREVIKFQVNQLKKNDSSSLAEFTLDEVEKAHRFQSTHPSYLKTPLVQLSNFAQDIGVKDVFVKDESQRFGLNAFKVLGGMYAIGRYLSKQLKRNINSVEELRSAEVKKELGDITFITATAGNHGKGVAWAAKELGYKAVIYLPKDTPENRVQAIINEGAEAIVTDVNYDDSVRLASKVAEENNWVLLQDTSWDGYTEIPQFIMQGYTTIAKEIIEQLEVYTDKPPTHLFLQVGVGSYAASVAAIFIQKYKENHPKIVLVEPHVANCYYKSFESNEDSYKVIEGKMDSVMGGLSCGEPNPQAWEILKNYSEGSISCDESVSTLGMHALGHPLGNDEHITSGASGGVTTGLLYCLTKQNDLKGIKEKLDLNENSQIILINTEGDTDKEHYQRVVSLDSHPLYESNN